jgi:hypothetical protein
VPGVGPRTIQSPALVAEVVHGTAMPFQRSGALFLAHGGTDGHPSPVPLSVYDKTIRTLKSAVHNARLGRDEEIGALKRLDDQARQLEHYASGPTLGALIAESASARRFMEARPFSAPRDIAESFPHSRSRIWAPAEKRRCTR